jgi:hypothetical protein
MCTQCSPSQCDPLDGDLLCRRSGGVERADAAQQVDVFGQQVNDGATVDRLSPFERPSQPGEKTRERHVRVAGRTGGHDREE